MPEEQCRRRGNGVVPGFLQVAFHLRPERLSGEIPDQPEEVFRGPSPVMLFPAVRLVRRLALHALEEVLHLRHVEQTMKTVELVGRIKALTPVAIVRPLRHGAERA